MEAASPAAAPPAHTTQSTTIADMFGRAAEKYANSALARSKRDGEWVDITYGEAGVIVSEIARGLIDLGLEPGDRVSLLANTRPDWTFCDFAITSAGLVVVPIFQGRIDKTLFLASLNEQQTLSARATERVAAA